MLTIPNNENRKPNRLANEKSPYLLQHAHNPVDWYPWGEEAFNRAKNENKSVFLSIGYSTCHWCHVMERESFEDDEVAEILNDNYISIKVDREERPDLDHFYMDVCQALTGSGGWPLTVFLTPDKTPFFAGTYFPKESKYGRPGLTDVLTQIRAVWISDRNRLEKSGNKIIKTLTSKPEPTKPSDPHPQLLEHGYNYLKSSYDPVYGGFGAKPKFPTPHQLFFLLRYWKQQDEPLALEMVERTLKCMYAGGIYDHVGYGFSRYSTDRKWLVPHFEKMLYDNALLALAYLETFQVTKNPFYARVAREIFTYVLRDMVSPQGGFYTAEDADSEGEEGKFYVWSRQEAIEILGKEEGEFYCNLYDLTPNGNFEGQNIPNLIKPHLNKQTYGIINGDVDPLILNRLEMARQKLFAVRERRIHPYKDDKILTSWNGLMIAALARGAWVLNDKQYAQAAVKATKFLLTHLRDDNGRLLARYRDGEANYPAYLDDYAFLVWGLIELYQATFETNYLENALKLTREMQDLFRDKEDGGFFFIGHDAEQLPSRTKELQDGAIPSGNSVAALNLLRLAGITGNQAMEKLAAEQLRAFAGTITDYPAGYSFYLCALSFYLGPPMEIVIASSRQEPVTTESNQDNQKQNQNNTQKQNQDQNQSAKLLEILRSAFLPQATILLYPQGDEGEKIAALAPHISDKTPIDNKTTIYLCQNYACQAPINDSSELVKQISQSPKNKTANKIEDKTVYH